MYKKLLTKNDLPVSTRVYMYNNNKLCGTIIYDNLINKSMVVVEWDDGTVGPYMPNQLQLAAALEAEFTVYQKEINTKLQEAAAALKEVVELAEIHDINVATPRGAQKEMFPVLAEIEAAMFQIEKTGWSASTKECYV